MFVPWIRRHPNRVSDHSRRDGRQANRQSIVRRRNGPGSFRLYLECLESRLRPSVAYDFDVMARSGQDDLTDIANGVSLNDNGTVAFVGSGTILGQGIYV